MVGGGTMSTNQTDNPLNMYQLYQDGPYVLPETICSTRRADFLRRGNAILGFYTVISIASKQGSDAIYQGEQQGKFKYDTAFRLKIDPGGAISQLNYGLFKRLFSRAGGHLTNQVFLMLYGSFEAYIADLVLDGLSDEGAQDPYQEALNLMVLAKWRGKVDRIGKRLELKIGKRRFVTKFRDIDMDFMGESCKDPLEFLEKAGELRHRLVNFI